MKKKMLLIMLIIWISAAWQNVKASSYPYMAVVKSPVCGVYKNARVSASSLLTQAIYNEQVTVLGKSGNFARVKIPDGYEGYALFSDLTGDLNSVWYWGNKVIVKVKSADVFDSKGTLIVSAPMSSMFYGRQEGDRYKIAVPGGMGYISKDCVMVLGREENIPVTNGVSFGETAKLLLGTKYLWGGCSSAGIDCSGLTYVAAKINGIKLPRDSVPQSTSGENVALENIMPGDQLFFSAEPNKTKVTHTGIYLGDGNFVHSGSSTGVVITALNESNYRQRIVTIKRHYAATPVEA